MATSYRHLDHKERTLIYWWQNEQLSLREIGRRLRRSHTSIRRALRRNCWCRQPYFPRGAQMLYASRMQRRATRDRVQSNAVRTSVHQHVQLGWPPALIAGRLNRQDEMPTVCQESIYQSIDSPATHLRDSLPRHQRTRKPKRPYRKTGERIRNRIGVD